MTESRAVKEIFAEIKIALEQEQTETVKELLDELFPADLAEYFHVLNFEQQQEVLSILEPELAVGVIRELEEDIRPKLISSFEADYIARRFLDYMDSDDAVDLLNQLPNERADEIISYMTDMELSRNIVSLLNYEENTAGGLMAKELIKVNVNWTLSQCVLEIRSQAENVAKVYSVYVVDNFDKLLGIVSLKAIILNHADTKVADIYEDDIVSVKTHSTAEEVASLMKKYDLVVLPVVDALNRLLGRITIDDVVDFITEEADKDYQLMSGISEDVEITDKVWILSRARLPWLLIGLLGGIASSRLVTSFEGDLLIHPQLAFFMPLVAAMGGNAGVQSSAIIVQGLANNTLGTRNVLPKLGKEFMVALLNGLICALIIYGYNFIIGNPDDVSYTVAFALISVIIFASILGTLVPMLLDKMNIDPALATGPFITTSNDLLGLGLYFWIGRLFL